jgi:hypothetical protein
MNKSLVAILDRKPSLYKTLGVKATQDAKETWGRLERMNLHEPNNKLE